MLFVLVCVARVACLHSCEWCVCVGGVLAWVVSVACLCRWRASVGAVGSVLAWVACMAWVVCQRG